MLRTFDGTMLLILALLATAGSAALLVSPKPECERSVCRLRVDDKSLVSAPCEGDALTLSSTQSSGATVIQCANPSGTAEENPLLLFDRHEASHAAYEFTGGRVLTPSADDWQMIQTEGVPDKFGPKPLCHPSAKFPEAGEFLIGVKQVQEGDHPEAPYCFELFLVSGSGDWSVKALSGKPVAALTPTERGKWESLTARLTTLMAQLGHQPDSKTTGRIVVAKAPLYAAPEIGTSKMYLVRGDSVAILDVSKASTGWLQISYVTTNGKTLEKWVRSSDVDTAKQ